MTMTLKGLLLTTSLAACLSACGEEPSTPTPSEPEPQGQAASAETAEAPMVNPENWPKITSPVDRDPAIEEEAARLLASMSLEEKVGQIIQPDIASITPEEAGAYHIGSVLNGGNSAPKGELRGDPGDWVALADAFWRASTGEDGSGIPLLWGTDAVHGHSNIVGATIFPHNIGLGAANDPELMRRIGEITAKEIAVTGLDWTFAPTLAVPQDDRWGRTYEGYSEDPAIVASFARPLVEGLQGRANTDEFLAPGRVLSTAKHFVGDGGTRGGTDQGETVATEEELRDIHVAGYVPALEAGVQTAMASFSSWNGRKMHGYKELLTDVLVGQMGLDGFVVGDWNGHGQVAGCEATDCPQALLAGVDMYMAPDSWKGLYESTLRHVEEGTIPMERLDEAVLRILRVKLRMGLMERGLPSERPFAGELDLLGSDEHRAVAREAVAKSLVLLKNEGGVLPIRPRQRVLITGDGANDMGKQTGGWTLSWQGDGNSREDFPNADTIFEGLEGAIGASGGEAYLDEMPEGEEPDLAVVVFGEDPYAEFRGDRPNLDFTPEEPQARMRALKEAGIPVVAVFLSGRPLWTNPEINASDAFVAAWLPGSEGGGVADVLVAGEDGEPRADFTGRLSFSWPKRPDQFRLNPQDEDYDPLFALGYGLSYGEEGTVGTLPEDYETSESDSNTLIADGAPGAGGELVLLSGGGERRITDAVAETPNGALRLSRTDRYAQEDSLRLVWDGSATARLVLRAEERDLRREANADIGLSVTYRYDEASEAEASVGVGGASFPLPMGEAGGFETFQARLTCFADEGGDLSALTDLMAIESQGPLSLTVYEVGLAPSEGGAPCPGQ
ncbi:glycoside hydrolase family 3 protein [Parvularcula maris]|uniref:Exo 1,3/1,4-beta-D-glucan glucohydrolase n=1 Tax=Parvularcula maris TaxID=2965077 RepID=A0A9X2LCQ9_9PROT|nr:glycoside hydrolase family 3 protein [Parvularcula maris]MCQ8186112.1 exo 1,3/1,4-beta-D-glucan glucohydrolase [Parvularcula maris]